jgi:hypothetical protein
VNSQLHAEICSPFPRNHRTHRKLLPRRRAIARLFLVIGLHASHMHCLYASALIPALRGKAGRGAVTASGYEWIPPTAGSLNSLGTVTFKGSNQVSGVPLLSPSIHGKGGPLACDDAQWNDSGKQLKITYTMGHALVHVTVAVMVKGTALEAIVDADQPVITSADMGSWSAALQAQSIAVPYYSGNVWYVPKMAAYVNAWWDWHTTQATKLSGTGAQYLARTDSTLSPFHERLSLVLSPDVDAVLPSLGNPASPYIAELAGRLVLDIWTPDFRKIEQGLIELGDYGITDCIGIIHVWQHAGYDNALPQHYPANEAMGGEAGLVAAVNAGKANGCLMALHENYVDYYPNYPKYDPSAVALNSDGSPMLSWLNRGTKVQSYSTKPTWMAKNASTQSPAIHERYGTTAAFLDVSSSVPPSSHGDMDAHVAVAGTLAAWMTSNTSLWSYERRTHEGPVLGEGMDHWYYSGLLDGVEAQFGAGGVPDNQGPQAPLFVDFDLKKIHPLQVNHGMGYYERWLVPGNAISNTLSMDAYRMQEIAFGHAPFLGGLYWNNIAHAFVECNLVSPVAKRYGAASVSSITYQVDGIWVSPSVAARSAAFSRVQVGYNNGLTIVANAGQAPLQWGEINLPQYGWAAKGKGLLAYTALCGSTVCDYAETSTSVFANARNQAASPASDPRLNSAGTVVSFSSVRTDGMISILEEHGHWTLRPFPRSRSFTVLLQNARFSMPASVRADGGSTPLVTPVAEGTYWRLPLTGAKSYSWPVTGKDE